MESSRIFGGRRALLPYEVQLCEALGITEEEYWQFIYLAESVNGKRRKGYDLIPDIVNMPPVAIAPFVIGSVSIGFYGMVAIGVALTYISSALAPKPKAPKTPASLQTEGSQASRRFAPLSSFNSLQELATLGETIPLIFTKRDNSKNIGGVRINSKLIWSQLKSLGTFQQLKAVFMLSSAKIPTKPDFEGYAIGDLLLKNYTNSKLALYYKSQLSTNNRLLETDKYPNGTLAREKDRNNNVTNDVFSVDWDEDNTFNNKIFCGVRTPTTQTRFGCYAPMPNMMRFQLPYELILKAKDASNKDDITKKRKKIANYYPRYAGFMRINNIEVGGRLTLNKNDVVQYKIGPFNPINDVPGDFNPWGLQDVKTALDSDRERIDDNISKGDSFLIGSAIGTCADIEPNSLWRENTFKSFNFLITDLGADSISQLDILGSNDHLKERTKAAWEMNTLQRVSIATISNNRECDVTEIGLKSKVFKQITGFPNVNSHPGGFSYSNPTGTLETYQDDNGNITLGALNKYVTRYSFFRLQARRANTTEDFITIDDGKPFAIKGRTPQFQYNFIRITHPKDQYEFRFLPYPGNEVKRNYVDNLSLDKKIRLLTSDGTLQSFNNNTLGFSINYSGFDVKLTKGDASNSEWYLGTVPEQTSQVVGLSQNSVGNVGSGTQEWTIQEDIFDGDNFTQIFDPTAFELPFSDEIIVNFYFDEELLRQVTFPINTDISEMFFTDSNERYRVGVFRQNQEDDDIAWTEHNIIREALSQTGATVISTHTNVSLSTASGPGSGAKVTIQEFDTGGHSWFLTNGGTGYASNSTVNIPSVGTFPGLNGVQVITSSQEFVTEPWPDPASNQGDESDGRAIGNAVTNRNLLPYGAIADFITFEAENPSHLDQPEHEIVYINEQVKQYGSAMQYPDLSVAGLRLNSGKEFSSFSQLSVYFKEGLHIKNLIDNSIGASNLFPDIVFALLTDPLIGAGDLIGVRSVDEERMRIASKFCKANGFFWDGVIVDEKNLREFIFQNAQYCLLDFTILGGRFSLFPSVPFDPNTFLIDKTQKPFIKALFTDGNTKNLQISFLSAEERQDFRGFATYRHEKENGFPEAKVISRRLITTLDSDPRENFDMSLFCTSETHAQKFLDYALQVRNKVDHGLSFDTTPQAAMHLGPGDYIRVHSEASHTSRFANGVITQDGEIQSQINVTNGTNIIFWKPGSAVVSNPTPLQISNGRVSNFDLRGCVFTVPDTSASDRVYKIESISYAEDGLINISASHAPLFHSSNSQLDGRLAILQYNNNEIV
tara:strand:- start:5057 stop:8914 length:3858 start_codon:yes stop_codon:yes gene_type:complete